MEIKGNAWVVGQVTDLNQFDIAKKSGKPDEAARIVGWMFQGVFTEIEKAIVACKTISFFIMPALLNEELPTDPIDCKCGWYPLAGQPEVKMEDVKKAIELYQESQRQSEDTINIRAFDGEGFIGMLKGKDRGK